MAVVNNDIRVIYSNPSNNGSVSILTPPLNHEYDLQEEIDRVIPEGTPYQIVDLSKIPSDRTYRSSWIYSNIEGSPFGINIEKAKEIHKDYIRFVREPLFQKLDVEFIRALETNDSEKIQSIILKKQSLRNFPELIDDIEIVGNTVEEVTNELKQIWDEDILGSNILLNTY